MIAKRVGAAALAFGVLTLSACAPPTAEGGAGSGNAVNLDYERQPDETAAGFDLEALIAAAKSEEPINVYDSTGKITDIADAFTKKYGVKATGVKMKSSEAVEKVSREADANNAVGDVVLIDDAPGLMSQLIGPGHVFNWVPGSVADKVPENLQNPLVVIQDPHIWTYNTEVYETCPVTNMWELTDEQWKGKVMLQDPLNKPVMAYWFNQMADHGEAELHAAYQQYAGEGLTTEEDSASAEWVKRLLANNPVSVKTSEESSAGVGAEGQNDPPMAMMASAKFRDNKEKGYHLGACSTMKPWMGQAQNKTVSITTGSKSPNAAKLFVNYLFTQEGIDPQLADGKASTNPEIVQPDDPSNIDDSMDKLFFSDTTTLGSDWDNLEKWQDFWRLNS